METLYGFAVSDGRCEVAPTCEDRHTSETLAGGDQMMYWSRGHRRA